jgi:putative ABC transport system permease protein
MLHDLKLACRRLGKAPTFTAVAIMTLALAIGANTAIFSIADAVLFKPLPYTDPDRVYVLATVDAETRERSRAVRLEYLQAINDYHRGLGSVALRGPTTMTFHPGAGETERIETLAVTSGYFRVLGVRAARGRLFESPDAVEPGRAALLTYESWQSRFGGDENIVGRAVRLGPETRDVIGVLPRGFIFPMTSLRFLYYPTGRPEYITVMLPPAQTSISSAEQTPANRQFDEAVVRLEPGVTPEQAQAEINTLVAPLRAGRNEIVVLETPRAALFPTGRPIMRFLVAAAALVLLIGCANLANMLLARTRRREREIGLHVALGATRFRLVRPIFFETLIVGIAAALLALLVTALAFDMLLRQVPPGAYGGVAIGLDFRVALFAVMLGILAGFCFAVLPAWWSARLDVRALVDGRPAREQRGAFGQSMIAAQVGLAIVLVFGAVIASRAFVSVLRVPLGFSPDNLIAINTRPAGAEPDMRAFYMRAVEALASRVDVAAASAGGSVPMDGFGAFEQAELSGSQRPVDVLHVLPGYFETIGISLVRGRLLTSDDLRNNVDAAVIAESAARALFPDGDAVGATFRSRQGRRFTIVGVVSEVQRSLSRQLAPPAYALPPQDTTRGMTIVARMRSRGPRTLEDVRRQIIALTPGTPVSGEWWSDSINAQTEYRNPRFQTMVLGTFAVLGLVLTALGIFAAITFVVAARTREMGVRLAIGAQPRSLVRLVVRQALTPVVAGILAGVIATQWTRRISEAQLFEVNTRDPVTLIAAVITVTVAALVAAYLPARHVTRVDPIRVLRAE